MDEKLQKDLKRFLNRIINLNYDNFYELYKIEEERYDSDEELPDNFLAEEANRLLKRLD